ncbi:amidohydrolase family protein [Lysobacter capsici]|uniref:amidohydrolase family protein n=1 Tax=Lysobacter capsici TaxID=435897 RepID=UPI00287B5E88|nr:amidohydrolase family protein [Lysobacter capsici]WND78887.1 amidohydrolase family protein [Lysobacter capsici]WND84082.1 amidohydrolase family protein [Lysobacter capsici]
MIAPHRRHALALSLLALACAATTAQAAETADLLIRHAAVIDVSNGKTRANQTIAVKGARILAIVDDAKAKRFEAARSIDAQGKYAIPALWDMHVHFGGGDKLIEENKNLLPLYVAHGIAAVRDAAGDLSPSVFAWREAINNGSLDGPTIFTSGPKLEGYKSIWPGDIEVGSHAEISKALDQLQGWKVDFVKITDNTLSPELFMDALKQAHARGLRVSAHVPFALTIDEVSAAGLSSIEHIEYAYKAGSPQEAQIGAMVRRGEIDSKEGWNRIQSSFDETTARAAYKRLARRGTAVTPTLNGSFVTTYLDRNDHRGDDYLKYIGPGLQATYAWRVERAAKDDAAATERRHQRYERNAAILPLLQQSGVTVLAGTDAGFLNSFNYPGVGLHDEMQRFVESGLTPLQTLQAATINGARFLGQEKLHGTLAAGKAADILLLDADPLRDISATRRIDTFVLRGEVHDREALDGMLEEVRKRVAAQKAE